ncbi:hypothetical protein [Caballeronia arationis]|uniref:hypothetical protein n=1 Tax=Caballeronia arationis TaxID=1777142 RepID=UPI00078999FC|nr:hypothetical protein [Caballeronia arationis]
MNTSGQVPHSTSKATRAPRSCVASHTSLELLAPQDPLHEDHGTTFRGVVDYRQKARIVDDRAAVRLRERGEDGELNAARADRDRRVRRYLWRCSVGRAALQGRRFIGRYSGKKGETKQVASKQKS